MLPLKNYKLSMEYYWYI